jgi:two-component system nitrate/nitrite response regulator NarL
MILWMAASVLIVDDNPRFRSRARRWLEDSPFVVVAEAANGEAALEAVHEHRPAVVLLDIELPGISGLVVASRLARASDPPAVVLTSTHDMADYGAEAADFGARGFIPKAEFSADALLELVH